MAVKKATATTTSSKKNNATKTGKQVPSPKGRLAKTGKTTSEVAAGDKEVTIDRRRNAREESTNPAAPQLERRTKVQRRRQIDPTTCERDYSDEEVGFMNAMDEYKRTSGRMFPTCSEVLEVIRGLGYVKLTPAELATIRPEVTDSMVVMTEETIDEEAEFSFDEE
jgi:hypothetical protein